MGSPLDEVVVSSRALFILRQKAGFLLAVSAETLASLTAANL